MSFNYEIIGDIMVNVGTTKIYKNNQTTILSKIRKEFNIGDDSIVEWDLNHDKTVTISFKTKKNLPSGIWLVWENLRKGQML